MERKETGIMRRLLALALCLVVAVTFIPLLGDGVYADEAQNGDGKAPISDTGDIDPDQIDISLEEPAGDSDIVDITDGEEIFDAEDVITTDTNEDVAAGEEVDENLAESTAETSPADLEAMAKAYIDGSGEFSAKANEYTLSTKQSGNNLYFYGSIKNTNYVFNTVFVDIDTNGNYEAAYNLSSATSLNGQYIDLSAVVDTGYHTVVVSVTKKNNSNDALFTTLKKIPVNTITATPNYSGRFYYVYSRYLEFYPFSIGGGNQGGKLFMEYSNNGGKSWQRSGYMQANMIQLATQQGYRINGLAPNKTYKTRLRYGTYVTYSTSIYGDGKSYFFGGPVRNISTVKTGKAKKPKIKSVKVKAVKVKRHKVRHYGYYTGVYLYTEKYYTYKLKVTVKLKKKPKAAGLWINGKFVKGNKKKYTATLPGSSYSTKKPKGKKFKVGICSYNGKSYGGFSPLYQKKKKIK